MAAAARGGGLGRGAGAVVAWVAAERWAALALAAPARWVRPSARRVVAKSPEKGERAPRQVFFCFFVISLDCLSDWPTHFASLVLASMIMRKDISGSYTTRHLTLLVFTFADMFPQPFHPGAVRCDRTFPIFVLASRGMSYEEKPLLLLT